MFYFTNKRRKTQKSHASDAEPVITLQQAAFRSWAFRAANGSLAGGCTRLTLLVLRACQVSERLLVCQTQIPPSGRSSADRQLQIQRVWDQESPGWSYFNILNQNPRLLHLQGRTQGERTQTHGRRPCGDKDKDKAMWRQGQAHVAVHQGMPGSLQRLEETVRNLSSPGAWPWPPEQGEKGCSCFKPPRV